jgi:hypothetical protein
VRRSHARWRRPRPHTVGCTDRPVFRRPVRRNPGMTYNRPYQSGMSHRLNIFLAPDGTETVPSD